MGTPAFAVPSLEMLLARYDVAGVVTQRDKPQGRGLKLAPPPVKILAMERGIPVLQPQTLKNEEIIAELKSLEADVFVVAAYGKILPKIILEIPPRGCMNVHASLLPKYRGAAPIPWAIANGETKTGITTMLMNERMDAGDILLQEEIPILPSDTGGTLHDTLSVLGAQVLEKTLALLEENKLKPVKQNEVDATYVSMIKKEDLMVDWNQPARSIANRVRAFSPSPCLSAFIHGKRVKLVRADVLEGREDVSAVPGQVVDIDKERGIIVATQKDMAAISELQEEGKKKMGFQEYLRGHAMQKGDNFSKKEER